MAEKTQLTYAKSLSNVIDTYWAIRILREWEKRGWTPPSQIGEREMLALVVFEQSDRPSLLERELGGVLGLPTSTASDLVKRLLELGLLERPGKDARERREKPLVLSQRGRQTIANTRRVMCERFAYLFAELPAEAVRVTAIDQATEQIKKNAIDRLRKQVLEGDNILPPSSDDFPSGSGKRS